MKNSKFVLIFTLTLALLLAGTVKAQSGDEPAVVLPLEAQTCNLPVAPARIPEDADMDVLKKAKENIDNFQAAMVSYRECLDAATKNEIVHEGNLTAVSNAHNYSVDMEERIAEQFNMAVCGYKQRKDMALSDTCKQRLGLTD